MKILYPGVQVDLHHPRTDHLALQANPVPYHLMAYSVELLLVLLVFSHKEESGEEMVLYVENHLDDQLYQAESLKYSMNELNGNHLNEQPDLASHGMIQDYLSHFHVLCPRYLSREWAVQFFDLGQ